MYNNKGSSAYIWHSVVVWAVGGVGRVVDMLPPHIASRELVPPASLRVTVDSLGVSGLLASAAWFPDERGVVHYVPYVMCTCLDWAQK